jgi:pyridoxal 5'-phosphate synthase pdxT subunit
LLANEVLDGTADQRTFGGLDITVRRNAFGRQVDSFESEVELAGIPGRMHAVFIRAPWVERVGDGVEVVGEVQVPRAGTKVIAVRQGAMLATSFHPEVTGDLRVHRRFVELVRGA